MSDTVKLIIEISKDYYEIIKHDVDNHLTDYRPFEIIANGTPLDDVKAKIQRTITASCYNGENYKKNYRDGLNDAIEILDNIGKAESEDKE